MILRTCWLTLALFIGVGCQHAASAEAAEPTAQTATQPAPAPATKEPTVVAAAPASTPVSNDGSAPPVTAKPGLPDKVAKEAAAKAIAALPACGAKPAQGQINGQVSLVTNACTELACIRTCCNTCGFEAVVKANGVEKAMNGATFRSLFPDFPANPLECEINMWNAQLKQNTFGVTLPNEKGTESSVAAPGAKICLLAAAQ